MSIQPAEPCAMCLLTYRKRASKPDTRPAVVFPAGIAISWMVQSRTPMGGDDVPEKLDDTGRAGIHGRAGRV
jgi:hypothetical protein